MDTYMGAEILGTRLATQKIKCVWIGLDLALIGPLFQVNTNFKTSFKDYIRYAIHFLTFHLLPELQSKDTYLEVPIPVVEIASKLISHNPRMHSVYSDL